jgi:drug/metabolite transporter (DMT)-like permease
MALAALITIPLAAPTLPSAHPGLAALVGMVILGVGASGIGIVLYYWLLNTLGAARASSVSFLLPVVALVWGALFLREVVSARTVIAMAIILAGVFLCARRTARPGPAT